MKKESILHGFVLCVILASAVYMFYLMRGNIYSQMIVGVSVTAAYIVWGILHHMMMGNLYRKIVIEYILVGILALVVMLTVSL